MRFYTLLTPTIKKSGLVYNHQLNYTIKTNVVHQIIARLGSLKLFFPIFALSEEYQV